MRAPPPKLHGSAQRHLRAEFGRRFGEPGAKLRFFRSSGRINLIGEHTDYNLGLVLPAAIQLGVQGAFEPQASRRVTLYSAQFEQPVDFSLDAIPELPKSDWGRYVAVTLNVLDAHARAKGFALGGMRGVLESDLPVGSGLSSSAALELILLEALSKLSGLTLDRTELARLGQQAEWAYGVKSGLLDQLAIAHGKKGEVSFIDTRTLERRAIAIDLKGHVLLIAFTKERTLGDEYNQRTRECQDAAKALGVDSLRDATLESLARLNGTLLKRARHVVTENRRVLDAVEALQGGDVARFGALLDQSHASLRDDYEVSCRELDAMVDAAREYGASAGVGVWGRMMGGGFGGPALLLVPRAHAEEAKAQIQRRYAEKTGLTGRFWDVEIEDGLQELTP